MYDIIKNKSNKINKKVNYYLSKLNYNKNIKINKYLIKKSKKMLTKYYNEMNNKEIKDKYDVLYFFFISYCDLCNKKSKNLERYEFYLMLVYITYTEKKINLKFINRYKYLYNKIINRIVK